MEITLNVPEQGESKHTLTVVKSSGVTFDTTTERIETDRASSFLFENGQGQSTGAFYDPATHELRLKQDVKLDWKPKGPHAKPMQIEAASLEYHEATQEIWLRPWGKMTRGNTVVEGENAIIHLQDAGEGRKSIQKIEAVKAHGTDVYPHRKLQYAADELWVDFNEDGVIQKITGQTNAQLQAVSDASETDVTAYHVEMNFDTKDDESLLTMVSAIGQRRGDFEAAACARPAAQRNARTAQRATGDEDAGGRQGDRDRSRRAPRDPWNSCPTCRCSTIACSTAATCVIAYGPQNHIESFRASDVRTQTDPTADEIKRNVPVSVTNSRQMEARIRTEDQPHDHHGADRRFPVRARRPPRDGRQGHARRESEPDPAG